MHKKYGDKIFKKQSFFKPFYGINFKTICYLIISCLISSYCLRHQNFNFTVMSYIKDVVDVLNVPVICLKNSWNRFFLLSIEKDTLNKQISSLKSELLVYEEVYLKYQNILKENEYLREILPIIQEKNIKTITVLKQVDKSQPFIFTPYDSENFFECVKIGNSVIAPDGFIGRVVGKSKKHIIIQLVTHIQSRIPVISKKSNRKAVLFGQNNNFFKIKYVTDENYGNEPFFENINTHDDFVEGEVLETYDIDGNLEYSFPVAKIVKNPNGKLIAKWIVEKKHEYMTIIIDSN